MSVFSTYFEEDCRAALNDYFGVTVTLRSTAGTTDSFTALFKDKEYESYEATGIPIKVAHREWTFENNLTINGVSIVPKARMVIIEGSQEYEIQPIPGKPAVEWMQAKQRWLVRTKRVTADG